MGVVSMIHENHLEVKDAKGILPSYGGWGIVRAVRLILYNRSGGPDAPGLASYLSHVPVTMGTKSLFD
jgi:hypothetical protein